MFTHAARRSLALSLFTAGLIAIVAATARADDKPSQLPLKKVVLFNSGVGFFEHRAEIQGDAKVDLKFNVGDVNDLLKSMVLQDLGGGKISTVTYGSMDPITKTLKTFAIDLTNNPTLADLLDQVRGEQVEIDAPTKITGTILGVEVRKQKVGESEVIENEYLNLLTGDGLRSVPLATVGRIKLTNEKLDAELRQALAVLALGHATDKKTVTLNFTGTGKRPVQVGYIQQAPIWKTSYRLVLDDKESPFLQGWAIVENTTEDDWKDVRLTLVSGRPISFVMNLYQPLYVPRPLVEPELFASLRPQTYGQDMERAEKEFAAVHDSRDDLAARSVASAKSGGGGFGGGVAGKPAAAAPATDSLARRAIVRGETGYAEDRMRLGEGVQSAAQAANVGELFQYAIDAPVTLPRQQSAMLPIVNGSVQGEKVSIYNQAVQAKHPLNGLKLVNSTGLHLMQGPITVFDDGAYAGDARIEDLQPGSERLISYAMDLDTEVATEGSGKPEQLVSLKLIKGTALSSRKFERSKEYTVKNSGKKAKKVLIEYPLEANWKLVAPEKPTEKTRDLYRFAVTAEPGKPSKLKVSEEQIAQQQVAITSLNDDQIRYYASSKVVSEAVKNALAEVVKRKAELQTLVAKMQQIEAQINTIGQEQARIRENMQRLDRNTDLYNRYVKKFTEQEDQIEQIRGQIRELQGQITTRQKALEEYLLALDIS